MKYRIVFIAIALTTAVASVSHASFQNPASPSDEKPLYHPQGNEASVFGTITVNGELPRPKKIDMAADPICIQLNHNRKTESLLANDQRLLNAFVYVKDGDALNTYRFEIPDSEVVLAHKNCQFTPRVLGLRAGQHLSIVNSDATYHNTHAVPKTNQEWNQTQTGDSPPIVKTFMRPELSILFKDNQHPWERAYVSVLVHPFFAVTDEHGSYEIRGLPPGSYKLVFWHEVLGEQTIEVTLHPGENRQLDVLFNNEKVLEAKP